jgi:phenylacetate-CoA ligase
MSKVFGRRDDMLVIRGVNVYPSEIEAVLVAEQAVDPQYLLVVDRTEALPRLVVAFELAAGGGADGDARDRVVAAVTSALQRRLGLSAEAVALAPGALPRVEMGKVKRVVERTAAADPLAGLV